MKVVVGNEYMHKSIYDSSTIKISPFKVPLPQQLSCNAQLQHCGGNAA